MAKKSMKKINISISKRINIAAISKKKTRNLKAKRRRYRAASISKA